MNRMAFAMILMFAGAFVAPTQTTEETNKEHTKWIAGVMDSINTIKPGMTREDLLKVFTTEGGLSNRFWRVYVYKDCPYIKVRVEFEAAENRNDQLTEMRKDRIIKISAPFLQYSVMD